MLEQVQVITEHGKAKFAVIPYAEFEEIRELLTDQDRLIDYLDYLHMQKVKEQDAAHHTLSEVKAALDLE